MRQNDLQTPAGQRAWRRLVQRTGADPERVRRDPTTLRAFGRPVSPRQAVAAIIRQVRQRGDRAVRHYLRRLEGVRDPGLPLRVSRHELAAAGRRVPADLRAAVLECAAHIRAFQRAQLPKSGARCQRPGVAVSERWSPLRRVGIYAPAGQAPLISTVLMNALPAAVAGVREIALATPPDPDGRIADALLFAAATAGVHEVYRLGGAVAMAAMACGTESVPRVDKLAGPGNIFVTEAKRQLVGQVGIDSLAGPSEILIIADDNCQPEQAAWDLLGQGEHGSGAVALFLSPLDNVLAAVAKALLRLARSQPRLKRALAAVHLIRVRNLQQAVDLANEYAPEHLSLQVRQARKRLAACRSFGAAFLGPQTPQALGDYTAGPNHVLPTNGTARWFSPLSVRDFIRSGSVVEYSPAGVAREGRAAMRLAVAEGLLAHAESIRVRMGK